MYYGHPNLQQNEKSKLGQKNYRRLSTKFHPQNKHKDLREEKKHLFIKMSTFFNWKKHQTNPISSLFIYRATNKLVK